MNDLAQAWSAANRSGQPLAVMMIDIDRFKSVNDTYGHAVGDKVLTEVAGAIRDAARKDDSVCRMGGEEFLVVCRNTTLKSTLQAAERLRKKVKALKITAGAAELRISISIGVASKEPDMAEADTLVNAADKALYAAKLAGRDRTCVITRGEVR
jgi:diguanylate cyclase (GGDEF)-like protein